MSIKGNIGKVIQLSFGKSGRRRMKSERGWLNLGWVRELDLHAPWVLRLIAVLSILILSMLII